MGLGAVIPAGDYHIHEGGGAIRTSSKCFPEVVYAYGCAGLCIIIVFCLGHQIKVAKPLPESGVAEAAVQVCEQPLAQRIIAAERAGASGGV